jgi:hypothetical protein
MLRMFIRLKKSVAPPRLRRERNLSTLFFLAILASPITHSGEIVFRDVALEAGFQDRLNNGRALVAAYFNEDEWIDFYVGNPGEPIAANNESFILLNNGPDAQGNFSFSRGQVLLRGEIAFSATSVDYDNDGDPDLFIGVGGQEGIGLDYLFRNDAGVLVNVSAQAGIRGPFQQGGTPAPTATSSGTWADYDNDGDLDLFVASRSNEDSLDLPMDWGWRNSLFRNNNDGTFTDVSMLAGVGGTLSSMTSAWGDFDNDGWMDLYVPHFLPAGFQLYMNNQDGTFREVPISESAVAFGNAAIWAASVADFNRDGRLDILSFAGQERVGNSHALLINQGNWLFTNEGFSSGLAVETPRPMSVMGTQVGDLNNDGYPDIYTGNGDPTSGQVDNLFLNTYSDTTGITFEDASGLVDFPGRPDPACVPVEPSDICTPPYPYRGHGTVFVDIDGDGDLDMPMVKGGTAIRWPQFLSTEPNRLFINDGGNANNWLFVDLEGVVSNRDGFGARVEVRSSQGGANPHSTVQQVQGKTAFSASGPPEMHFGLGQDDTVDEIVVQWPSGVVSRHLWESINTTVKIQEPVFLSSNFNDGSLADWAPALGTWSAQGGSLLQNQSAGAAIAVHNVRNLTDFTVVGKLTYLAGTSRQLALMGRSSPDGLMAYGVILNGSTARIFKSMRGVMLPLTQGIPIEPMVPGKSYIVALRFQGSSIELMIDRESVAAIEDSSISNGAIAVMTVNTAASFDNIVVY